MQVDYLGRSEFRGPDRKTLESWDSFARTHEGTGGDCQSEVNDAASSLTWDITYTLGSAPFETEKAS